ncbi:cyclic pyranopterin monophosphate synthase MoaC [Escherichia coli]|uniref:cyclic pyranopterin monophosphate synthase MoaC n=1 Tax=Escherichia coli TaxID=562 RepID=UPI000FA2CC3A|nr:cyclic pyranopterin monophosphate synthase MoaC [Escherichia coli]VDH23497.1 molybdenum cofactor biosynthesis protein C [Escherichia coli]
MQVNEKNIQAFRPNNEVKNAITHLNEENQPKMVDIGDKETTERIALASGRISMNKEAYDAIINHCVKKGPVLQTAIIAGIMGAKKTSELIPMLPFNHAQWGGY